MLDIGKTNLFLNDKAKYWSNKNKLKPNEVLQFSKKKIT